MLKQPKAFHSERLTLKPTNIEDAPFLVDLLNSPKWLKYIGDRNIKTIAQAENHIKEKILTQFDRLGYGNYTVIRKSDGVRMGSCGLYDRPGLEGIDIGFAFLPEYEGQGYGFESAKTVLDYVVANFSIDEICAITSLQNKRSQVLLEKIGLKYVKNVKLPGNDEELMYYIIKV